MRNHLINELTRLAETDQRIMLLIGDLGFHVVDEFARKFPDRYFNAGIAEQNMTAVAAGLALEGNVACTYSTGLFPTVRCLEQIRNSVCYHKANVKIIAVGCGFIYGPLGMSHHGTEDIAAMRSLPNLTIFSPADPDESVAVINEAIRTEGPCYIRLGRGGEPRIHPELHDLNVRKILEIRRGTDIAVISTGSVIFESIAAAKQLADEGSGIGVYNCITLKPIDAGGINAIADSYRTIITLEEHNVIGGLGSAIADVIAARDPSRPRPRLVKLGLQDEFTSIVGSNAYLREHYGLSADRIVGTVKSLH